MNSSTSAPGNTGEKSTSCASAEKETKRCGGSNSGRLNDELKALRVRIVERDLLIRALWPYAMDQATWRLRKRVKEVIGE